MKYDVIVLGGGSAGMSAALYCKRANLDVGIIDNYVSGGRPLEYLEIENYLGLGKIASFEMIEKFKEHIALFDIPVLEFQNIEEVDLTNKVVKTAEETYEADAIIIATGSKPRKLGVPGEEEHIGKGVHYCAICDGPMYKDKIVAVIGGGNSACEEALGLSKICEKVYIIEFTDKLNADAVTVEKINQTENIEVYTGYVVNKIEDEKFEDKSYLSLFAEPIENYDKETGVIEYATRPTLKLWVNGIFPYVGMKPNHPSYHIINTPFTLDEHDYIITDEDMKTSIDGVYAVGDIRSKKYRQVITAVSDGAIAGIAVRKYLSTK